ncbi:MAG: RNA-directed DNA polymerase [Oculatellaceae cyanobacterium Prado106]|jgi:retron-type reverse transcriptase|nr:RNA-directed DNA polymerase [Oculatellaceae cyanobacterium Prado106]
MKRYGSLWPRVVDFSNLLAASRQAQRGKRFRENVLRFNYRLEQELHRLQTELQEKTYTPGTYKTFEIKEPKPRLISAAPYRDRVVHHALCNIIGSIFENSYIHDSYANRLGFGTHRALRQFTRFSRSSKYVLQCDIKKNFPSINHAILKTLIRRKIKCQDTLWLIETLIDSSNPQESAIEYFPGDDLLTPLHHQQGLPIGNLTSQFFANLYLNGFDHYVKETLKARKYLRYVDDFALFSDDLAFLTDARLAIEQYLATLRLKIHPVKSQCFETRLGANFLGFRVLPTHIRVRAENLRRARRRLHRMQAQFAQRELHAVQIQRSLQSWGAHLKHGDTWQLRQQIFSDLVFRC